MYDKRTEKLNEDMDVWQQFYDKSLKRHHHPRTERAAFEDKTGVNIAIDCGCGTGADFAFLAQQGYRVIGFDSSKQAVDICQVRFHNEPLVDVQASCFENFSYPKASLIIANSSLFFAQPDVFYQTWLTLISSLDVGGVFAGDFLGLKDDWSRAHSCPITSLSKSHVMTLFDGLDIIDFYERDELGQTLIGQSKHWHTYSILARKQESIDT